LSRVLVVPKYKKTLKSFVSIIDFEIFHLGLVNLVKTTVLNCQSHFKCMEAGKLDINLGVIHKWCHGKNRLFDLRNLPEIVRHVTNLKSLNWIKYRMSFKQLSNRAVLIFTLKFSYDISIETQILEKPNCMFTYIYIHTYPPDSVRNIGRPQRASIVHGCWLELVVRQKTFSHILSRQCASRWLWGILLITSVFNCGKYFLLDKKPQQRVKCNALPYKKKSFDTFAKNQNVCTYI
jgi:hypothetical protein